MCLLRLPGGIICVSCGTHASLSVVLVVYHELALEVRCRSYQSIMLPTLGGYTREVALLALCCASLLIAGPVWVIFCFFDFCTVIVCCYFSW